MVTDRRKGKRTDDEWDVYFYIFKIICLFYIFNYFNDVFKLFFDILMLKIIFKK